MTTQKAYGSSCPFCSTAVPEEASVCSACGAMKGTRSDTFSPGQSLIRASIWLNVFGFIFFVTGMIVFGGEWATDSVLKGTNTVCTAVLYRDKVEVVFGVPWPESSKRLQRVAANEPCKSMADPDLVKERMVKFVRAESQHKGVGITFDRFEDLVRVNKGNPNVFGYLKAAGLLLLTLLGCFVSYKVASFFWVKIFGRVSDPMWYRRR